MSAIPTERRTELCKAVTVTRTAISGFWLILGVWTWSLLGPTWVAAMRPLPYQVIDHYQDWGSARNYWVGLPVYTPHSVSIPRHLQLSSNPVPSIEYNAHPPASVLLALPLARLSYPNAVLIWNVISLVALAATFAIIASKLVLPWTMLLPTMALLPLCLPVLGNIQMAQLTLVLGFIVAAIWALERSGRSCSAALLLGIAGAIKLFPGYLVVYYLARRRYWPLLFALLSFLLLNLATASILGADAYRDYIRIVLPRLSVFQGFGYNLSIAGLWHKLFDPAAEVTFASPLWPSATVAHWGTLTSDLLITVIIVRLAARAHTYPAQLGLYLHCDSHDHGIARGVGYHALPASRTNCRRGAQHRAFTLDADPCGPDRAHHLAPPAAPDDHGHRRW